MRVLRSTDAQPQSQRGGGDGDEDGARVCQSQHIREEGRVDLVRVAKLAIAVLLFGVAAVPVTCVDAHGPHSLYAPPDAQASSIAATLATHHGDRWAGESGILIADYPDAE